MPLVDAIHNVVLTTSVSRLGGGFYHSVRRLHQEIAAKGAQVTVHAGRDRFSAQDGLEWNPLQLRLHRNLWTALGLGYYPRPRSLVDPDGVGNTILHVHGLWQAKSLASWLVARKYGLPCVVSPRGMLDPWAVNNSGWKKKLAGRLFENRNLREAACLHALCNSEADAIRACGLKNPIAIIPNGVDLTEMGRSQASGVRSQNNEKKQLLFLGRIHPKKGLMELIEAWGMVRRSEVGGQRSEWELVIAGWDDGGHLEGLRRQTAESGLADSVHFPGPVHGAEKDALFRDADAFVLPSFSEGLPMSVLEAWAHGLPVVMTKACNLPDGFRRRAAILARPNPESIAAALHKLFALSEEERREVGKNGRQLVQETYAWPRLAGQMHSVYLWILGKGDPPDCLRRDDDGEPNRF